MSTPAHDGAAFDSPASCATNSLQGLCYWKILGLHRMSAFVCRTPKVPSELTTLLEKNHTL
eukprot:1593239-Amphidinium_carterae.1